LDHDEISVRQLFHGEREPLKENRIVGECEMNRWILEEVRQQKQEMRQAIYDELVRWSNVEDWWTLFSKDVQQVFL